MCGARWLVRSTAVFHLALCSARALTTRWVPARRLQVAQKYMPVSSLIIGVDLVPIRAIPHVITHAEDITTAKCRSVLKKDMGKHKADVVLHDGAPNVGAAWVKDAFGQVCMVVVLHRVRGRR